MTTNAELGDQSSAGLVPMKDDFGAGGSGVFDGTLRKILLQLRSIKTEVVPVVGDGSYSIPGMSKDSVLQSVFYFNSNASSIVSAMPYSTINADGDIEIMGEYSNGHLLVTFWPSIDDILNPPEPEVLPA